MIKCVILSTLFITSNIHSISPPKKPQDWDEWSFSEKIKWRGLNPDPRIPYQYLADKLIVKEIVKNDIATARTIFSTNDASKILMSLLPKTFVMKANNASNRSLIIKDDEVVASIKYFSFSPKKCNDNILRKYAKNWLSNTFKKDLEKHYEMIRPMILIEEYIDGIEMEFQLFFFNGKIRLIAVLFIKDYKQKPKISYYDVNWNLIDTTHPKFLVQKTPIEKPTFLNDLIAFGQRYAEKIDHVRTDFFITNQKVYFGEFTFTDSGGQNISHLDSMIKNYWDYPDEDDPLYNPFLKTRCESIGLDIKNFSFY